MGLFVPVSTKVFNAMPKLRIAGVSRAGVENVNVAEATRRGILVFNVEGATPRPCRTSPLGS
jgi:D-3-phosphoglycerate dehydrogenase